MRLSLRCGADTLDLPGSAGDAIIATTQTWASALALQPPPDLEIELLVAPPTGHERMAAAAARTDTFWPAWMARMLGR